MDFFKEFGKQVSNVARSVTDRSKESAEATKAGGELRAAREALEQLYARYGKACYALQSGRGNREAADALALRIRAAELQVAELAEAYDAAREVRRCLSCGAVHPKEARFCSACGKRLSDEPIKPEPMDAAEYCLNCGAKREGGEARCPVCGADFNAPQAPEPAPGPDPAPAPTGPDAEEPEGEEME